MINKTITLPVYNIVIILNEKGGGSITSNLKETCPYCGKVDCYLHCEIEIKTDAQIETEDEMHSRYNFNKVMDAIESIILAHAVAGIDVSSRAYVNGIDTAVFACSNNA